MALFITTHSMAVAFLVAAVSGAAFLSLLAWATRREPRTGRHDHRRGVRVGTPTEIRRHRRDARRRTWTGTRSVCARRPSNTHVLDETARQRCRTANRMEETGEVVDLHTLLGPRPELAEVAV